MNSRILWLLILALSLKGYALDPKDYKEAIRFPTRVLLTKLNP